MGGVLPDDLRTESPQGEESYCGGERGASRDAPQPQRGKGRAAAKPQRGVIRATVGDQQERPPATPAPPTGGRGGRSRGRSPSRRRQPEGTGKRGGRRQPDAPLAGARRAAAKAQRRGGRRRASQRRGGPIKTVWLRRSAVLYRHATITRFYRTAPERASEEEVAPERSRMSSLGLCTTNVWFAQNHRFR